MEDRGEDGYAIVADYMASLTTANGGTACRAQDERPQPCNSSLYAKYSGDMPAWVFLELTSFSTLIDFVRFCARRWDDRRLLRPPLRPQAREVHRNCAAHGSCLINCFAERAPPGLGVQRCLPKGRRRGNSQGDQEEVDGEYGHAGGRDRARGALRLGARGLLALARRIELAEMFAGADGGEPRRCPTGPTPQLAPRSSSFAG